MVVPVLAGPHKHVLVCVAMTQSREWAEALHKRVAGAIKTARETKGVSAQQLADETERLGYPISRSQIANYESGRKRSLDIAELIVLSVALSTSPVALVHSGPYDAQVEFVPDEEVPEIFAAQWFSGLLSGIAYVPYEARNVTVGGAVYDRNHAALNRARERAELEQRRTALRYDLARRRARGAQGRSRNGVRAHRRYR